MYLEETYFYHLSDVFKFGAYKGLTLSDVIDTETNYIYWCLKNIREFILTDSVMEEIHRIYPGKYDSLQFEKQRLANIEYCHITYSEAFENEGTEYNEYFNDDSWEIEQPTYGRYAGSYAQDEMGYSDDDIDTIFDGDPFAYWNID